MFRLNGFRPFIGEINCPKFTAITNKFIKLAANQSDEHIIPEYTPLSSQGSIGSCVGNSVSDCWEILKGLEDSKKVVQISRLFLYWNARNYIHETNKDEGCFIKDALDSLTKLGTCRESTWAYDTSKVFIQPPIEAYREANDNTFNLSSYYQIATTSAERHKDIETAIKANHPVVFGCQVGADFMAYKGEKKVFDAPIKSEGGHAMIIVGIRKNTAGKFEFNVRNSWGQWGDNGHCWISENYVDSIGKGDIFVPTLMIDFLV